MTWFERPYPVVFCLLIFFYKAEKIAYPKFKIVAALLLVPFVRDPPRHLPCGTT